MSAFANCAVPSHTSGAVMCQNLTHAPQETYPYSITPSARASSVDGTVMPRAFAALKLTTSSNLVGCIIGKVGGLSASEDLVHVKSNL